TRMMLFAATIAMSEQLAPAAAQPATAAAPTAGTSRVATAGASMGGNAAGDVRATAASTNLTTSTTPAATLPAAAAYSATPLASAIKESDAPLNIGVGRLVGTLILSFGLAIGLFFLLPLGVVTLARPWVGDGWLNLTIEGLIRLGLLLGYLYLIGRLADVQRVFQYHGAEHKTINAYEAGDPLDVAHVRRASRVHTRCGTGFLLIVVVVSIVVFALLGNPPLLLRLLSRVALVPVIASIAYELLRLGAANYRFRVVRWLLTPSLALQGLTTREPDDGQMECAIAALERVLKRDGEAALDRIV
ncbi:MAG: DUF1385 domain-containing protein, partial [Ktedonobacterales bacterium]